MKHSRRLFVLPLLAAACACAFATNATGQVVTRFEVVTAVISPDGDGRQDSTVVRYALADTALALSLTVLETDSVTAVYTLRASAPDVAPGPNREFVWRGQRTGGAPAGEGPYLVELRVTDQTNAETVRLLPVTVDTTPPAVQVLSVIPNPYAPGLSAARPAVEFSYLISDASPPATGRSPDRLGIVITNPAGIRVDNVVLTTDPPYTGASGSYTSAWDATELAPLLTGGEYTVTITLDDAAGYSARSVYHFDIDVEAPTVRITTPATPRVRVVPDSLRGRAFDANGVDSLYVKYPSSAYQQVANTLVRGDSLVFAVLLADSVAAEGTYPFSLRAVDRAGRERVTAYSLIYDLTAPPAPVLEASGGTWRTDVFPLAGTADTGGDAGTWLLVERNHAPADSLALTTSGAFTLDVALAVGRNEFVAYLRDGAGNLGAASNTVVVSFKSTAGVYVPVPFPPGGTFQVNADRVARAVTLRVFDVAGDLVTRFEDGAARQYYSFAWNGRNSSDRTVRRGPLVAVATIEYDDGTRDVFREVFLFDSNP